MAREIGGSRAQPGTIQSAPPRPPMPAPPTRLTPPQLRPMQPRITRPLPPAPPPDRMLPQTQWAAASPAVQLQTSEKAPPPANIWQEAVGAVLDALGSLGRPSGGANAADVQQRMADQAGLAIPAQQWLKEEIPFSIKQPTATAPATEGEYGRYTGIPDKGGLLNDVQRWVFGNGNIQVATPYQEPNTYAHEGLHAWWNAGQMAEAARQQQFMADLAAFAATPQGSVPANQWQAYGLAQRQSGNYLADPTELYAYIGQSGDLRQIPDVLQPYYYDYFAPG